MNGNTKSYNPKWPKMLVCLNHYNLINMKIGTNIQMWCPFNWTNFKFRVHDFNMDGLDQPLNLCYD
jgi:hypothetical protein